MLNVIDAETHSHVATINYGFEPPSLPPRPSPDTPVRQDTRVLPFA